MTPQERYLDLLKKTLSFSLWPEPPVPVKALNIFRNPVKRAFFTALANTFGAVAGFLNIRLMQDPNYTEKQRRDGQIWPGYAHTMIGMPRLNNLQYCVETILKDGIEGDLIETGVWRGGSCIFMKAVLASHEDQTRRIFVADSFAGLPPPDTKTYPVDKGDKLYTHDILAVSEEDVRANFENYGLMDERVVFLKGWFKDTLPVAPIDKLAVLRLDGDMYSSTIEALEALYPKLSVGGFCIIDDYALSNCAAAVTDFRKKHGIREDLVTVDWSGVYWRKSR